MNSGMQYLDKVQQEKTNLDMTRQVETKSDEFNSCSLRLQSFIIKTPRGKVY